MTTDTETRFRIELHGENSGLLDTISGDSMEGARSLLIDKLVRGLWTFNHGDTIKVVSAEHFVRYVVAVPPRGHDKTTRAYTASYNEIEGNWTDIILGDDGVWRPSRWARLPKVWKTKVFAEKRAATVYSKHNLVVLPVNMEGHI